MNQFIFLISNGISVGALYALIALGIVLIYKSSGVVTFMHASLVLLGAFIVASLDDSMPFWGALALGLLAVGLLAGVVAGSLLTRSVRIEPISLAILTIGLDLLVLTFVTQKIEDRVLNIDHPWGGGRAELGLASVSANRAAGLVVATLIIVALLVMVSRSSWGLSMRAVAERPEAAALMGLSRRRVTTSAWVVAGLLACTAGVFMAGSPTPGVTTSIAAVALRAFPAAILGGLDSIRGAIVGGLMIGVAESLAAGYASAVDALGSGFAEIVPFLVMVGVLLVRPAGLFGTRELERV